MKNKIGASMNILRAVNTRVYTNKGIVLGSLVSCSLELDMELNAIVCYIMQTGKYFKTYFVKDVKKRKAGGLDIYLSKEIKEAHKAVIHFK